MLSATENSQELIPYIPQNELLRYMQALPGVPERIHEMEGGILFVDLVGFTPLSVTLGAHEAAGLEKLQSIMSDFFTAIITLIHEAGGVVYQFAGDSILVSFARREREDQPDLALRLASTAWRIMEAIHNWGAVEAFGRSFYLTIRAGASLGRYRSILLGSPSHWLIPVLAGPPVEEAVHIEGFTAGSEVLLGATFLPFLREARLDPVAESGGQYFRLLELRRIWQEKIKPLALDTALGAQASQHLLLPALYEKVSQGGGSFLGAFREITCVFVHFRPASANDFACIQNCYVEVQEQSLKYGGNLVQTDVSDKGVMLLVLFGAPAAQEKKEQMAAGMSLHLMALQKAERLERIQCGITTGFAYCGDLGAAARKGYTVLGEMANISARLSRLGAGSAVFADNRTVRRIQQDFFCESLDLIELKGFEQPVAVFEIKRPVERIMGFVPYGSDTLSLRRAELEELKSILADVRKGSGQICMITGSAGSGKSRLLESFLFGIPTGEVTVLTGRCHFSERNTPFHPWKEILQLLFQIFPGMSKEDQAAAILSQFGHLEVEAGIWLPFFMRLFGLEMKDSEAIASLDEQTRKKNIFRIVAELLESRCRTGALILVFDDMQWMDDFSFQLLETLSSLIKHWPLLLLLTGRPDRDLWALRKRWHFNLIELGPLNPEQAGSFLAERLQLASPDPDLEQMVLSAARGNPYYLDAIVRNLKESGQLQAVGDGKYALAGAISHLALPGTLQEIILARLDRLSESAQTVLKAASILGSNIAVDRLQAVVALDPEVIQANLIDLTEREFLTRTDDTFDFINPVVKETIYNSILLNRREELHLRLAESLEQATQDVFQNQADSLAYHFTQAGKKDRALHYRMMAALQTKGNLAFTDALHHLGEALLLTDEPGIQQQIRMELAEANRRAGNNEQAARLFAALLETEERPERQLEFLLGLALTEKGMGNIERYQEGLESALRKVGLGPPPGFVSATLLYQRILLRWQRKEDPDFSEIVVQRLVREMLGLLIKLYQITDVQKLRWAVELNESLSAIPGLPENRVALRWKQSYDLLCKGLPLVPGHDPERRVMEAVIEWQMRTATGDLDLDSHLLSRPARDAWDRLDGQILLALCQQHKGELSVAAAELELVHQQALKSNASFHRDRALALLSWGEYLSGSSEVESIKQTFHRIQRSAQAGEDSVSRVLAAGFSSFVHLRQGLEVQASRLARQALDLALQYGRFGLELQTGLSIALGVLAQLSQSHKPMEFFCRYGWLRIRWSQPGSLLNLNRRRCQARLSGRREAWQALVQLKTPFLRERALILMEAASVLQQPELAAEGRRLLAEHGFQADLSGHLPA